MKRREGGRRDRADGFPSQPFSSDDAFCAAHLHCVRILEPPPDERTRQIHHLVVVSFFADWRGHWLGHVSILALRERYSCGWIHPHVQIQTCFGNGAFSGPYASRHWSLKTRQAGGSTSRRYEKAAFTANRFTSGASQGGEAVSQQQAIGCVSVHNRTDTNLRCG